MRTCPIGYPNGARSGRRRAPRTARAHACAHLVGIRLVGARRILAHRLARLARHLQEQGSAPSGAGRSFPSLANWTYCSPMSFSGSSLAISSATSDSPCCSSILVRCLCRHRIVISHRVGHGRLGHLRRKVLFDQRRDHAARFITGAQLLAGEAARHSEELLWRGETRDTSCRRR